MSKRMIIVNITIITTFVIGVFFLVYGIIDTANQRDSALRGLQLVQDELANVQYELATTKTGNVDALIQSNRELAQAIQELLANGKGE